MPRLGIIADAGRPTGFSAVCHAIGDRLIAQHGYDIDVLAVGWDGADPPDTKMRLYRAEAGPAHHYLGFDRVVDWLDKAKPDVVLLIEDPAIALRRLTGNPYDKTNQLANRQPVLAYTPVDGYHYPPKYEDLAKVATVLTMSRFGQTVFHDADVVYHGVDQAVFHEPTPESPITTSVGPVYSKAECRELYEIPRDAFVVGRVDTNSGRKDWGATVRVIDAFNRAGGEAYAVFHTKRTNPAHGVDLPAIISRTIGKFIVTDADNWPINDVVALMNTFDVFLSTSRGEGFGLNVANAMACGVPALATGCSAISEVVGRGGILVPPKAYLTNPFGIDLCLADVDAMTDALRYLAGAGLERARLGEIARTHVTTMFDWDIAAAQMHHAISSAVSGSEARPMEVR